MARSLWFAAGAGAAFYAMNRARHVREAFTADGLRDRVGGAALGVRLFRDEVAQGRHVKETELRERLGLVPDRTRRLAAPGSTGHDGPDGHDDPAEHDAKEGSS